MKILVLLSLLMLTVYVGLAWQKKGGAPISISSIAYIFPKGVFSVVMSLYAFLSMPRTLEALPDGCEFIGFLCFVGIFLVAASPYFRTEWRAVHNIGGFLFGVLSQFIVIALSPYLLLCWIVFAVYLVCCSHRENWAFWAEVTAGNAFAVALLI